MNSRFLLFTAGLLGATGVAMGASGAHGLRDVLLERGTIVPWETAARYQMLHAVALLAAGSWRREHSSRLAGPISFAAVCWFAGTILFCGSLYGLALGGPRWLGPVTPVGGLALISGWIAIGVAGLKKEP
jgi:uncharacterized membrane protein YgdD (TMEM256/DUF423 family)